MVVYLENPCAVCDFSRALVEREYLSLYMHGLHGLEFECIRRLVVLGCNLIIS